MDTMVDMAAVHSHGVWATLKRNNLEADNLIKDIPLCIRKARDSNINNNNNNNNISNINNNNISNINRVKTELALNPWWTLAT